MSERDIQILKGAVRVISSEDAKAFVEYITKKEYMDALERICENDIGHSYASDHVKEILHEMNETLLKTSAIKTEYDYQWHINTRAYQKAIYDYCQYIHRNHIGKYELYMRLEQVSCLDEVNEDDYEAALIFMNN
jgi:hypothetical protein